MILFLASLAVIAGSNGADTNVPGAKIGVSTVSPDGRLAVTVQCHGQLSYDVTLGGQPVVVSSRLGLAFSDGPELGGSVELEGVERRAIDFQWENHFGKFRAMRDHFNETRLRLREKNIGFDVVVRVYDDGIAFRYVLPKQPGLDKFRLAADLTQFLFSGDCRAWAGKTTSYECQFPEIRLSQLSGDKKSLPLVVETPAAFVAVAEADVRDWSGSSLVAAGVEGMFGARAELISPVQSRTPRESPWHALIIGKNAGDLTVSTLLANLAAPSRIADVSWIKPGLMAWDSWWTGVNPYWSQYKGVHARGKTRSHKDYIDLAAAMGWPYMLVDWYWYDQGSKDPETAIKPLEHIDMPELMSYAKAKGVRLVLWVNSKNIPSIGEEKLFDTYSAWGAAGVKIDFFPKNGSQSTQRWAEELLASAARHRLVVDFHGAYTPTGFSRTWPNLLTQEGVLGEEYCKLGRLFSSQHMVTLPFTRGLLGPADVTPGGFLNRTAAQFVPDSVPCQVEGSRTRQLALSVMIDSPLLCLADSPVNYLGQPGIEFFRGLPTTWDETRVVSSEMTGHLVQARRNGNRWWVVAMNNDKPLALDVPLGFLGSGKFSAKIYSDTSETVTKPESLGVTARAVTSMDTLKVNMAPAGGFAAVIEPDNK